MDKGISRDENGFRNPFAPGGGMAFTSAAVDVGRLHVVEGAGDFPVDMLRYDHAYALTPIPHPNHPWYGRRFRVVVGFQKPYAPTPARWESFGWRVLPQLGKSDPALGPLRLRVLSWRGGCHRCGVEGCQGYAMSWFGQELICENCFLSEHRHPDFNLARSTMRYEFKQGHYPFAGIGWPGRDTRVP